MKVKFYTLMYVETSETRQMGGKQFSNEKYLDLYVKNACILDKTLRINNLRGGG